MITHPIQREAARVLERLGGDVRNFAARQITSKLVSDAGLVLTMTKAHRQVVLELAPQKLHRTFTLSEAARLTTEFNAQSVSDLAELRPRLASSELLDVRDPIGQGPDLFAEVGLQIAELVPPIIELCRRDGQ